MNGYDLSFLEWFRKHGWQIRTGLGPVAVWTHGDAPCSFTVTDAMVERLAGAGALRRIFPDNITVHEEAWVLADETAPAPAPESSPKYSRCPAVASLHERNLTISDLSRITGVNRVHLNKVLLNKSGRGGRTRKKVSPYLTDYERRLLGWDADGNLLVERPKGGVSSSQTIGKQASEKVCSTWNNGMNAHFEVASGGGVDVGLGKAPRA